MRWAVVVLAASCASAHLPRVPGEPAPALADPKLEGEYQEVLDRSTRSAAIYDNLDTRLFVRAVWQSPAFVEARVRRESLFKAAPPAETDARVRSELERCAGVTEFFLAVHANDPKLDDFSRADSIWRLALAAGGEELLPVSVERLGRTNVNLRTSYSWMESFWVGYRVRFPRLPPGRDRAMDLVIASAMGRARFEFPLE
jgi:hypothetical protein